MNKEEVKEYLKRADLLELKLTGEDKDTYQWLLFGYNECARLLNEKEQENKELQKENQSLRTRIKTIKRRRKHQTQKLNKYKTVVTDLRNALEKKNNKIDKAIEITHKILMNNADNRMICTKEEEEYFDWLDKEMLEQEKILKGDVDGR